MDKRETFELMRAKARPPGHVSVALDARVPGVVVPLAFANDFSMRLNFCRWHGKGDFEIDDWGVRETLCFSGAWVQVEIPWTAIYGLLVDGGQPVLFGESVPNDFLRSVRDSLSESLKERESTNQQPPAKTPPKLRLVK